MKTSYRLLLAGMLAMVFSATAVAHSPGGNVYVPGGWSGNATVWGNSHGQSGWTGAITYSAGYGYLPGYVPWVRPNQWSGHGSRCHHAPGHRHARAHRHVQSHSYGHGRGHDKKRFRH